MAHYKYVKRALLGDDGNHTVTIKHESDWADLCWFVALLVFIVVFFHTPAPKTTCQMECKVVDNNMVCEQVRK